MEHLFAKTTRVNKQHDTPPDHETEEPEGGNDIEETKKNIETVHAVRLYFSLGGGRVSLLCHATRGLGNTIPDLVTNFCHFLYL